MKLTNAQIPEALMYSDATSIDDYSNFRVLASFDRTFVNRQFNGLQTTNVFHVLENNKGKL